MLVFAMENAHTISLWMRVLHKHTHTRTCRSFRSRIKKSHGLYNLCSHLNEPLQMHSHIKQQQPVVRRFIPSHITQPNRYFVKTQCAFHVFIFCYCEIFFLRFFFFSSLPLSAWQHYRHLEWSGEEKNKKQKKNTRTHHIWCDNRQLIAENRVFLSLSLCCWNRVEKNVFRPFCVGPFTCHCLSFTRWDLRMIMTN